MKKMKIMSSFSYEHMLDFLPGMWKLAKVYYKKPI